MQLTESNYMKKTCISILQANHGDAFIIECVKNDCNGVVIIDGGPSNMGGKIVNVFEKYSSIDLMVLTHYDDDHIAGILRFIEKKAKDNAAFPVKEMWVNNCINIPLNYSLQHSYGQAIKLEDVLKIIKRNNPTFSWEEFVTERTEEKNYPFATIRIISPKEELKNKLIEKLLIEKKKHASSADRIREKRAALEKTLRELAAEKEASVKLDNANHLVNASSIAFIMDCDGLSILMLGDSYADTIYESLSKRGYSVDNPLVVDYVKVAHHGSKNNSSCKLYDIIECTNYIITTNGGIYHHPDRETIAKIVHHPRRDYSKTINIYINYPASYFTGDNAFLWRGEEEEDNFKIHYEINRLPL